MSMEHDEMAPQEVAGADVSAFPQSNNTEQMSIRSQSDEARREAGAPEVEVAPSTPSEPHTGEESQATSGAAPAAAHEDEQGNERGPRIEIDVVEGDLRIRGGSQQ